MPLPLTVLRTKTSLPSAAKSSSARSKPRTVLTCEYEKVVNNPYKEQTFQSLPATFSK